MMMRAVVLILAGTMSCCVQLDRAIACKYSDFAVSPYDHLIEKIATVTMAELAGRLNVRPSDVAGGWPSGMDARIELHGPGGLTEFLDVAGDGTFARPSLRPGTYCYKVSASGFRSMIGTVVIDRAEQNPDSLIIDLMIAE